MGFKIADAYVEVKVSREEAQANIDRIDKRLKELDDKVIQLKGDDQATPIISKVQATELDDKWVRIGATDEWSAEFEEADTERIADKKFAVIADTEKAKTDIRSVDDAVRPVDVPVEADTGKATEVLQGLGDLGTEVGDRFSGGMIGALSGGIAGAVASLGMMIVDGIAEKVSESNKVQRSLAIQFENMGAEVRKFTELFDTNLLEDWFGQVDFDQNLKGLREAGVETEQLVQSAMMARSAFTDFATLSAEQQRALTVEINKVAIAGGIDVPDALKGASAAARTFGMSGWDATRLVEQGFQRMDSRGDDWAESLQEYSPYFKRLGLNGQQALDLIVTGLDHGARNTDIMSDAFKEFSLRVVDGSSLTRDALSDLGLDADKTMAAFGKGGPEARQALDTVIDRLNAVQDPVERNQLGVALMGTQWEDAAKDVLAFMDVLPGTTSRLDATSVMTKILSERSAALKEAFAGLREPFESAAKTADKVTEALDRMNDRTPTLRDTTQAWNDLVREFSGKIDWDESAAGVQRLSGSLVNMRGEVDTTTAAGSKLEDWANSSREAFINQAGALREAGVPADQMSVKLNIMRDAFIKNAEAQGLPRDAARRLADAYGLVPDHVTTAIYAPGLLERMHELNLLSGRIVTLPDGRFTVTGNDDPARNTITKLVTDYQGKVIQLTIKATARGEIIYNAAGGRPLMAEGGPITGPGTDTSDDIPIMASNNEFMVRARVAKKNKAFLEWFNQYGDRMPIQGFAQGGMIGDSIVDTSGQPSAFGGPVTINMYPPADMDYDLLAAKVSRKIELARQGRG